MSLASLASAFQEILRTCTRTPEAAAWKCQAPADSSGWTHLSGLPLLGFRFTGALAGEVIFSPEASFSQIVLTLTDSADTVRAGESWLQLWRENSPALEAQLSRQYGQLRVQEIRALDAAGEWTPLADIVLSNTHGTSAAFLCADAALLNALAQPAGELSGSGQSEGEFPADMEHAAETAPLGRVIDVPLAVTLRFGQRQLTLRELLELNTGSLVELDQQVEEPVNLMLGERVIARGEVVIVDGNYGMRVLEVIESPAQRLVTAGR